MRAYHAPRKNQGFGLEEFQVDRDRLASFFQQRGFTLPERQIKPGVYFLTLRGEIVYIGSSVNPMMRIGQHRIAGKTYGTKDKRGKEFDGATVYDCETHDEAVELEGALLRQLEPPLNGGRVHSKFVLKAPGGHYAIGDREILAKHGFLA